MAVIAVDLQQRGRIDRIVFRGDGATEKRLLPVLAIAMSVVFRNRKSLTAVTNRAAVFLDRMGGEQFEIRMSGPRLLDVFQPPPEHTLMAGRTSIDPVQVCGPDLLNPPGYGCWIHVPQVLGHDRLELTLVVLPIR